MCIRFLCLKCDLKMRNTHLNPAQTEIKSTEYSGFGRRTVEVRSHGCGKNIRLWSFLLFTVEDRCTLEYYL